MEKNCGPKRPKRQVARKKKITADRVDLFVANYVRNKYPIIYKEGVLFHDKLRRGDPEKLDLRKSMSYRAWIKDQNIIHGQFNNFQLKVQLMNGDNLQAKPQSEVFETIETIETLAEGDVEVESAIETTETLGEGEPDVEVESPVETIETLGEGEPDVEVESPVETIETLAVGEAESTVETAVRETFGENILQSTLETPIPDNLYDEILKELREDEDITRIMRDIEDDMLFDEY